MNFDHLNLKVDPKSEVAHQNMMKQIKDAGWGDKRWLGMWGRLIKQNVVNNGFCPEHLQKLISRSKEAEKAGYNARGWLRNRLQKADWRKYL